MIRAATILILSQDSTLFRADGIVPSDTRRRHIRYAEILRAKHPGSQVRIVSFTRRGTDTAYELVNEGLEIFGTRSLHRATFLVDVRRILARFRREGWRPSLVTAQTPWEEALIGLAFARRWRTPFLAQFHSDFYGRGFRRERTINEGLYRISRSLVRRSDHIRAVSSGIRDSILAVGDALAERVSVIPVPVDFAPETRVAGLGTTPSGGEAACPIVLFVGRLVEQKDLALWLHVAATVARALPQVRFVLAGDGPQRAGLKARADALGLEAEFLGDIDHRTLPHLYAQASVLLLTSIHEGLGRVVVEAMLAGVPVVSTDIVGPRDLIADGRTGWLVAQRTPAALAAAVIEALTVREKAAELAGAARHWAEEHYAFEAVAGRLTDLWAQLALERK